MIKFEDEFIYFDRIHERDRHTDRHTQTPHDDTGRACIAVKPDQGRRWVGGSMGRHYSMGHMGHWSVGADP